MDSMTEDTGRHDLSQPIYTINEAAAALRINRATVYRHARRGQLPLVKIGLRTMVRRADLEALIKARDV
jgi:excisionase family DNA binding protein